MPRCSAGLSFAFALLIGAACSDSLLAQGKIPGEKPLSELLPRIPGKSLADAQKAIHVQNGFKIELVAAEPDVTDPIDAAFDEQGRMYVIEMNDYPFLPEQRPKRYVERQPETWGRIRLLEDRDDDGKMDKSTVFADKLRWPQSVCCYDGGVFVISIPNLWYFKDTDGDGVADVRDVILSGFNNSNVQGLANGLEWGLEHQIYFVSGLVGGTLKRDGKELFTPGRRDIRFDPKTMKFELRSGGDQYGHGVDDFGERFVCNNSNHIEHIAWPLHYLDRNPQLTDPGIRRSIAKEGAAAVVYRTSGPEPWRVVRTARRVADPNFVKSASRSEQFAAGFFTSATGVTIYRGGAYPPEYYGNAFIGDVGANLVHRKKVTPDGISFIAERTEPEVEFLTSDDNWFRPTNFVNAPDGTLYVLDMCRETIEHPASIPEDIKEFLELESGNDRGRIYRLAPPNWKRPKTPNLGKATTAELVASLSSNDGWARDTANRLIWERQDKSAAEPLRKLIQTKDAKPVSVVLALYSLDGLKTLTESDVVAGLNHADAHVREHGLRLAERLAADHPAVLAAMTKLVDAPELRVRWQLAFSLGQLSSPVALEALKKMTPQAAADPIIRTAWLSSVYGQAATLAADLLKDGDAKSLSILVELIQQVAAQKDETPTRGLLAKVLVDGNDKPKQVRLLTAVGEGLKRRGQTLSGLAAEKSFEESRPQLAALFKAFAEESRGEDRGYGGREAGARLLAYADVDTAVTTLPELFTPQTPPALQQAAVKALAAHPPQKTVKALLGNWRGFGPSVRRDVVDALVQSEFGATKLLEALSAGDVKASEIERDKKQLLVKHPQEKIRTAAQSVLDVATGNRKKVVDDYQAALALEADVMRGKQIYTKTCSVCHKVGNEGHAVGPDLNSAQNKSVDDLLIALLDPNREAQPAFINYTAQTLDGKVFTGIIATENAASVTLKRAEAKEDLVQRDQLEALASSGQSLMPEGLEKDLNKQQIADILAFIKSLPPPAKK